MDPSLEEILDVFHCWVVTCRTSARGRKPVLGDKRRRKIKKAIELYDVDTCKQAIQGVVLSPWHMGYNPSGKKYDDIELILRDEKHIEQFLSYYDNAQTTESEFKVIESYANGNEPF